MAPQHEVLSKGYRVVLIPGGAYTFVHVYERSHWGRHQRDHELVNIMAPYVLKGEDLGAVLMWIAQVLHDRADALGATPSA